jgi:glycosyltransferase involved in cell wall biosynthesis
MAVQISGLINTWNEADTIRYAIASLATWCDEVLVVDQQSSERHRAIARSAAAPASSRSRPRAPRSSARCRWP